MSISELVKEDLDSLLELYGHLHDSDYPLPERQRVEIVWNEALGSQSIKYFGYFELGAAGEFLYGNGYTKPYQGVPSIFD